MANISDGTLVGAAVDINYGGRRLLSEGFGVANKEKNITWSVDNTLHRIASVTKMFPAMLLYQAQTACFNQTVVPGHCLDMHSPVQNTIPKFSPPRIFNSEQKITWHQLSSQLSGLDRGGPAACLQADCTNSEALGYVQTRFPKWPPGTRPAYSNWGFALLGNLLAEEVFDDANFSVSVASRITQPMGLANTGMEYTPEVLRKMAAGYSKGVAVPFLDLHYQAPAGSAFATAADLTTLCQHLLAAFHGSTDAADKLGISVPLVRLMLRSPAFWNDEQASGPSGFGTPWELTSIANFLVVSKGGNLPGYATLVSMVPRLNVSIVMAINDNADDFSWMYAISDLLLPALNRTLVSMQPYPVAEPGPHAKAVLGTYVLADITVIVQEPAVPLPGFNHPVLLIALERAGALIASFFLDFVPQTFSSSELLFRMSFPPSAQAYTCFLQELVAQHGANVVFHVQGARAVSVDVYAYGLEGARRSSLLHVTRLPATPYVNVTSHRALLQQRVMISK